MTRYNRRQVVQGAGVATLGLIAGCGLPFAAPPPTAKVHRIACLLGNLPNAGNEALQAAFRQGLADLGYVEGQNILIEVRHANGEDQLADPAAELVGLQPEVILVPGVVAGQAVRAATTTIPIVSAGTGDLVVRGLAASHARPGSTVTGLSTPSLEGKRLQLLQETVPSLLRVAVLLDMAIPDFRREPYEAAARALGLQLRFLGGNAGEDLEPVFESTVRERTDGLYVPTGPVIASNQQRIAELAVQSRLPSMWAQSEAVSRGGLMAYGPNRPALYRRAAYYVDRILKGTSPADLPIEEPREFEFVINLKTAQALGLTIPHHVLLQATEFIQ
jgi:putative tryptophan/tyrosine transport system substrate-binding protein